MSDTITGLMRARRASRLYTICTHPDYGIFAGHARDGRQLLLAEWLPDLVVGLFDSEGNLQLKAYHEAATDEDVDAWLKQWYGLKPSPVQVKQFKIPPSPRQQQRFPPSWAEYGEPEFAIAPFPFDWEGCYDDPSAFPTDDPDYVTMVQGWIDRENFVMYWGNELHWDARGQVVGT